MILIAQRIFAMLAAGGCMCTLAMPAAAHPLGNFTINHLARVQTTAHQVLIHYVLDIAEIPSFQIMRANGAFGPAGHIRLDAWAETERSIVISGLNVQANGEPLSLRARPATVATRPGAGGLPTLYWSDELDATLPTSKQPTLVRILDRTYQNRIGWKDIVLGGMREPTDALRHYPSALLGSPRDVRALTVMISASGKVLRAEVVTPPEDSPGAPVASQVRSNTLSNMLSRGAQHPLWVVLTLVVAIGLGALHALEPGHGKTLLAVSLVGARATTRQALQLALALTLAHTSGVLALGIVLMFAAGWVVPESIYPWITVFSGAIVALMGAGAIARIVRRNRGAWHGHDGNLRPHLHVNEIEHTHTHGGEAAHAHDHAVFSERPLTFRNVVLIAISGNIAPCPAALVVLLAALTLHEVVYGLAVVVAFSVGLASVLTGLGIALVRGAVWIAKRPSFDKVAAHAPLASACIIAVIGSIMLAQGAGAALQIHPFLVAALTMGAIAGFALSPGHTHAHIQSVPVSDQGVVS